MHILTERGLPQIRALVSLGLVDCVRYGDQLGVGQVIGELLPLRGGPGASPGSPGVGKGDDVVDILYLMISTPFFFGKMLSWLHVGDFRNTYQVGGS